MATGMGLLSGDPVLVTRELDWCMGLQAAAKDVGSSWVDRAASLSNVQLYVERELEAKRAGTTTSPDVVRRLTSTGGHPMRAQLQSRSAPYNIPEVQRRCWGLVSLPLLVEGLPPLRIATL